MASTWSMKRWGLFGILLLCSLGGYLQGCGGSAIMPTPATGPGDGGSDPGSPADPAPAQGASDTLPPTLSEVSLSPDSLDVDGGVVAMEASATDDSAVDSVVFQLSVGDASPIEVPADLLGDRYVASYQLPANLSATDLNYGVSVMATDVSGNQATSEAGQVTVAGAVAPPGPPTE